MSFAKLFSRIVKNQLVSGGTVLFLGSFISSIGGYVYHLAMGRMLGVVDYGILASLFALSSVFNIPTSGLNLVVAKEASGLKGKGKLGEISYFYSWFVKKATAFSLLFFLILALASSLIAKFLHLDSALLVLLVVLLNILGIYVSINNAILQSFLKFKLMSAVGILVAALKLATAFLLVILGFKVWGAMVGVLISVILGFFILFWFVKKLLREKPKRFNLNASRIINYAIPAFFSTLAFTSMYTVDVLLARHFLPSQDAGLYASLSTLGKIIFFASGPIAMAMFPMVAQRHSNGENYLNLLVLGFGMVFLICFGASAIYFLFPSLMVNLLFGKLYLEGAYALGFFALFMSFYSLSYLLVNFSLSIGRVKVVSLPVAAAFLQVVLILFFHKSLVQVAVSSIAALGLLLLGLVFYNFFKDKKVVYQVIEQLNAIKNE